MTVFDPADPRWITTPGPLFDEIRETNPVHLAPSNTWVVSEHADALAVLRSRAASSDNLKADPAHTPEGLRSDERRELARNNVVNGVDARPFLFRDPPDHTRLRGLVQRAFTPRRVSELTPFITQLTDEILDRHLGQGEFDAVSQLAWAVPVRVIGEMLAIPEADHATFAAASNGLAKGLDPDFMLSDEDAAARDAAVTHFALYFHELFAERRRHPGDDLLSALIAARDGDDELSEMELLTTAILLLVAGHETTTNLISGALNLLGRDEQIQSQLRANPPWDRSATDEFMRLVSPVQLTGRTLLEDIELPSGHTLPKGWFTFVLIGAANRDPAVFDHPTEIQLTRDPNPQLGFGFGLHHCLGAPLARLETQTVLRRVLDRSPHFEVTGATTYRPNMILRGLASLPLSLS
jgi:cytochrome P450